MVSIPVASTELSAIPGAADLVKLLRPPRRLPLPTAGPAVLGGPSAVAESMPSPPGDTQVAQTFSPVLGSPMVLDPDLPDGDLPSPGPPRSPEAFPAISPPPSPSPAAVQPDASLSGRLPPGARVGPPVGRRKSGPKVATPSAKVLGKRKARSDVEESPVAAETPPAVRRSTRVKKRRGSNPGGGNDIQKVPAPAKTQGKKAKAPVLTAQGTKPYRAAGTPRGTFIDRTDIKYPHRICGGETAHAKFVDMVRQPFLVLDATDSSFPSVAVAASVLAILPIALSWRDGLVARRAPSILATAVLRKLLLLALTKMVSGSRVTGPFGQWSLLRPLLSPH